MAVDATTTIEYKLTIKDQTKKPLEESKKAASELAKNFGMIGANASSAFSKIGAAVITVNQGLDLMGRAFRGVKNLFDSVYGSSIALEKGVAGISTLFDSTAATTAKLTNDIIRLQRQFGTDQQDIIKAYYEAIASGAVSASDAMGLMINAEKLAIGGMTSLQSAVDGLTGIISAFGLSAVDAVKINDALFIGAAAGKTNIDELVQSLGQASAFANAAGVSFQELIGSVSALTAGGVQTSEAVTQVRSAMVGLAKQSDELQSVLYKLNITNIKQEISQNGLVNTLKKIVGASDGTIESLVGLFGRVEAVNAVLALTNNTIGKKYSDIMVEMGKNGNAAGQVTEKAFSKMANTVDFKINQMKARLSTLFSRGNIGEMFNPMIDAINSLITVLERLKNTIQGIDFEKLATSLMKLSVAIGLVVLGFSAWATVMSADSILVAIKYVAELGLLMAKDLAVYALVATKWLAIAGAIVVLVGAVDILIRNIGNLGNLWNTVVAAFEFGFMKVKQGFSLLFIQMAKGSLWITELMNKVGVKTNRTVEDQKAYIQELEDEYSNLGDEVEPVFDKLVNASDKIDKGFFGDMFDMAQKAIKDFGGEIDKLGAKQISAPKIEKPEMPEIPTTKFRMPDLIPAESIKLITASLGSVFGSFAASLSGIFSFAIMGFAAAANIILDAIKQIIEFIPQIVNKVADIINMITELPIKILDAFKNLNKSLYKFVEEFIPNLVNAIADSFDMIEEFPTKLTDAFMKLFDKLPDLMVKLAFTYIRALLISMPRVIINIITGLIRAIPAFIKALVEGFKLMAKQLPKMLSDAFKGLVNDIAKIFRLAPPFKIDIPQEKINELSKTLQKSASDLFSVTDLMAATRGTDLADRIRDAINSSVSRAKDIFTKLWNDLENAWRKFWKQVTDWATDTWGNIVNIWRDIWDGTISIVTKTWDSIVTIWRDVWDFTIRALTLVWEGITNVWRTVWDTTITNLTGTWSSIVDIWRILWDGTIKGVTETWNGITATWKETWAFIVAAITLAWQGITEIWRGVWGGTMKVLTPIWEAIGKAFSSFEMPTFSWPAMPSFSWPDIPKPNWWNLSTGGFVLPSSGSVMNKISDSYQRSDLGQATRAVGNRLGFDRGGIVPFGKTIGGVLFAQGGAIAQGTDVVPAQLTPGEFVVNREAARANLGLLSFMNNVKAPLAPNTPTNNFSVVINAKTDLSPDQIRREVIPTLERELKRKSQEGKFIIATSGVRSNK